jgi:adenine-specific DNA-methyltransferase
MIKYLGSKRRLVPVLGELLDIACATTALDLFTGTTRVAQEFKRRGATVTAVDVARYSEVFAHCYIATDAATIDKDDLADALARLNALEGKPGYFTETFCERSRYVRPENGARVDAIRDLLESDYRQSPLFSVLLTSLIEATDRVDSTTGVQMAYLKQWAPRAANPLCLRIPELLIGTGTVIREDAPTAAAASGRFDLAYLDPPYNQHRYFTNYHLWETLVAWDRPEHYGVACKRIDSRDDMTKSAFNRRREMPAALAACIDAVDARLIVVSYNNEAWITLDELRAMCAAHGRVAALGFNSRRYVGAQIGIHNPEGVKVGAVSHLHNTEYLVVAGDPGIVGDIGRRYPEAVVD